MKNYVKVFMVSILIIILSGCSSNSSKQTNNENNTKSLSIWTYFSQNEQKVFDEIIKKWGSENNTEVLSQYIPFGDYKKQISVAIASDSLPDIIMIDNPDHAAFASMGVFEDITAQVESWENKDAYFEGPLKSTMYNDKYYGLPITSNCLALFYNKQMFEEANINPPTTWEELMRISKEMTTPEVYGLGLAFPKNEEATFQFMPWLVSSEGSYNKINSEGSKKAFNYIKELVDNGGLSKEIINWSQGDTQKQFSAGKLAMFVGGPWMIEQIRQDAPNIEIGVTKIPMDKKYASVLGGENLGIVANSPNKELAWNLLSYLGEFDVMKKFISQTGFFPPRKDVAQEPQWTKDPIKAVFTEQMEYAVPRGPDPKWPEISSVIYTTLQEVISGSKEVNAALDDAQQKIDKLIE